MQYKGKLYGKVGTSYFPMEETTEDIEKLRLNKHTDSDMQSFAHWIKRSNYNHIQGDKWREEDGDSALSTYKTTDELLKLWEKSK